MNENDFEIAKINSDEILIYYKKRKNSKEV